MNKQSKWLAFIKRNVLHKTGTFEAKDDIGTPIILEWTQTDIQSPELATFKKNICEIASEVISPTEAEFLRAHPEAVSQELFLKSCSSLFEHGVQSVNWKEVEEQIKSSIKQFYLIDITTFGTEVIKPLLNDIYFYVTIKNKKNDQLLGFIMFAITPALEFGNIKIINLVVRPVQQNHGLEQLLLSVIFRIIPEIKRLFLYVRPTNKRDIKKHLSYGFNQDLHPSQDPNHKVDMNTLILLEYKTEDAAFLQKVANGLMDIKR